MYFLLIGYLFFDEICSLFFTLFGVDFDPNSEVSIYVYIKILFGVISILFCLIKVIFEKKTTIFFVYSFFVSLLIASCLILTSLYYTNIPISRSTMISFGYLIPFIILCGLIIPRIDFNKLNSAIPYVITILCLTGVFGIVIPNILGIYVNSLPGFTYQNTSYFFSMGFLLTLIQLLIGDNRLYGRFLKYLYVILLVFFLSLSFLGGGKGALVTNVFGFLFYCFFGKINLKKFFLSIIFGVISYFVIIGISQMSNELYSGIDRAISFISFDSQTLWNNSSGRDTIYKSTLHLISLKPILGWGLGSSSFTSLRSYPHNIFLEILLDGGVFYFSLSLILILLTLFTLFKRCKRNKNFLLVSGGFLFNLISLQFSGSYLYGNYFFWFGLLMYLYIQFFNKNRKIHEKDGGIPN